MRRFLPIVLIAVGVWQSFAAVAEARLFSRCNRQRIFQRHNSGGCVGVQQQSSGCQYGCP